MTFYEEYLMPMIRKTCDEIEQTPQMQEILHGTMSLEKFRFQIRHNYQYLLEYTRCWAVGFSKCRGFDEMYDWYQILSSTMEGTVLHNRDFWAQQLGVSLDELEATIMAEGKRSYTSHQLARAMEGGLPECMMALFPCNILYRFFGDDLLPQCALPKENLYYQWLEFYTLPAYRAKCDNEIRMVNALCDKAAPRDRARLLEIFAESCNYEFLQWRDMYYQMETWPLPELFSPKFTTIPK